MMIDRIRPDDPSRAPATISSLFSSTKPIATAARPAYEFSNEITVGMSAPPIGITSITPNTSDSTISTGNRNVHAGLTTSRMPMRTPAPISEKLTKFWPG